jgi:hypothetical protein
MFFEDMGLLIVKNHQPMQFVESLWMKCLCLHLCPKLVFLSKKQFSQKMSLELVVKTKQLYVYQTTFDLWKSKGAHGIFFFVIELIGS